MFKNDRVLSDAPDPPMFNFCAKIIDPRAALVNWRIQGGRQRFSEREAILTFGGSDFCAFSTFFISFNIYVTEL